MNVNEATAAMSEQSLPRPATAVTLASIGAVFVINAVILAYAISVAKPSAAAKATAAAPAPGGGSVAEAAQAAKPATPPVGAAKTSSAAPAVTVVTPINLPDAGVVRSDYIRHCSACHGVSGRGDGPAAAQLYPRPRDFVGSPLRFASTAGSQEELVTGLERTISDGVPRSAMVGFRGVLSEAAIAGLARYILGLRAGAPPTPATGHIDVGLRPPTTPGLVAHGEKLYTSLGCVTCHGEKGHGDGVNSRDLVDSTGRPVRPADLGSGLFKSGQAPEDLVRRILTGVPGTPMIAYESVVARKNADGTTDLTDAWAVAAYIRSLTPKAQPRGESSGAELTVQPALDPAMLHDPAHVAWLGVEPTVIQLRPLWQREEENTHVDVRAVHTDDTVAICLDWRDRTQDVGRDLKVFTDAVAVMFAQGADVPALPMGVQIEGYEPEAPVNIWHWKASRQFEASTGAVYAPPRAGEASTLSACPVYGHGRGYGVEPAAGDAPPQLPDFRSAQMAGNPHEDPRLRERAVLEGNALGFGTLALQGFGQQHIQSVATWSNGLWRVILARAIETDDPDDIALTTARRIPITFAVWDGSKGDRDGIKLISGWHWLRMQPSGAAAAATTVTQGSGMDESERGLAAGRN
jgi:DMSO reductase family type II enzyme heme b subunit